MEINIEVIKKSLNEVFEELNLHNCRFSVVKDLVAIIGNNIHNIEHIQSSDNSNTSWTVRIFEINDSGKPLGAFSIPSKNERAISDVKDYVKENVQNLLNLK